jgi:hypothetical protein
MSVALVIGVYGLWQRARQNEPLIPNTSGSRAINPNQQHRSTTQSGSPSHSLKAAEGSIEAGTFEFKWPGNDCWIILRGETKAAGGCGSAKQALQAGTYIVKPSSSGVFLPFEVVVKAGATVSSDATAGTFEFKWPGNDCWVILRGETKAAGGCGSAKLALQAGSYTVKPSSSNVFMPFEVLVTRGQTTAKH